MSNRKHQFTCDECGATAYASAAWKLRHRPLRCLACARIHNGWRCGCCGSTDPHHPLPCPAAEHRGNGASA